MKCKKGFKQVSGKCEKKRFFKNLNLKNKKLNQAFLIGIGGSLIFKGIELFGQKIFSGATVLSDFGNKLIPEIIIFQFASLLIISSIITFILIKRFKKLWMISFVPFLWYFIKELMNTIFVYHKFIWIAFAESLIGIPIGFGLYFIIKRVMK